MRRGALDEGLRAHGDGGHVRRHYTLVHAVVRLAQVVQRQLAVVDAVAAPRQAATINLDEGDRKILKREKTGLLKKTPLSHPSPVDFGHGVAHRPARHRDLVAHGSMVLLVCMRKQSCVISLS